MNDPYITTFSGRKFHFLNPSCDELCIEDIAHSLSQQARFTGHLILPYNTAEHCVHVSQLSDTDDMLAGLLHDAGEAYMSDVARPIKHGLGMEDYRKREHEIQAFIYKCFGVPWEDKPPSVARADAMMLGIEARDLMHPSVMSDPDWTRWIDPVRNHPFSVKEPWSSMQAEREFLVRYYNLTYNHKAKQETKAKCK